MNKIEELVEQKATAETINAELVQEKQLGDTKKGKDEKKKNRLSVWLVYYFL